MPTQFSILRYKDTLEIIETFFSSKTAMEYCELYKISPDAIEIIYAHPINREFFEYHKQQKLLREGKKL